MTLTDARLIVRQFTRNGTDTGMYTDANVDRAIAIVGNHFVRNTRCTKRTDTIVLTAASPVVSMAAIGATAGTFRPELLIRAWISAQATPTDTRPDNAAMNIIDYDTLRDTRFTEGDVTGVPTLLAFKSFTSAEVHPIPKAAHTLSLLWVEPFVTFTAGTGSPNTITINVADDLAMEAFALGATSFLQHTDPEHAYASGSWKLYTDYVASVKGRGNLGPKVVYRRKAI